MSNTNYQVFNPLNNPILNQRKSMSGRICLNGVTRDTDPDGTIISVNTIISQSTEYYVTDISIFTPDNTTIINNTMSAGSFNNLTAYILTYKINFFKPSKTVPSVTSTAFLNPTGTADAIINQIAPLNIDVTRSYAKCSYAITIYGASQKDSNDLFELISMPSSNPAFSDNLLYSCVDFNINF